MRFRRRRRRPSAFAAALTIRRSRASASTRSSKRPGTTATPPCRVHGRTVEQKYDGPSRWSFLKEVKQRYPDHTILGSGDVFTAHDAVRMLRETGVDIVWIARGAIGNPWIFRHAATLLQAETPTGTDPPTASTSSAMRWPSILRSRCRSTANRSPAGACGRWGSSTAASIRKRQSVKSRLHRGPKPARLDGRVGSLVSTPTAPASGPIPRPPMRSIRQTTCSRAAFEP